MLEDGRTIELPPNPAPFLSRYLDDIGPVIYTGTGRAPIEWGDIIAWEQKVGFALPPWQARLLRSLSRDYLNMLALAEDPACPPPWLTESEVADNRDRVAKQIGVLFRSLAKKG